MLLFVNHLAHIIIILVYLIDVTISIEIKMKKHIVFFTGAGMSAESGLATFRDMGGLWEQYEITDVATPEAWQRNQALVLDFYNQRRKQLQNCQPNLGHQLIAELEKDYTVSIVTQNVDDLHERAGSTNILHLHGELTKVRSTRHPELVYQLDGWELKKGDSCEKGHQLRPHIVWFGEAVPEMDNAIPIVQSADVLVVIGTSLNVYPAAGLVDIAKKNTPIYLIDPNKPSVQNNRNITYIEKGSSAGMQDFIHQIRH